MVGDATFRLKFVRKVTYRPIEKTPNSTDFCL